MATKADCICRPDDDGSILYNPRCRFHKGPDKGYGYDSWGQPNGKYSEKAGTVLAVIVVGICLAGIVTGIVLAFVKW